jgi:acetolactate synthase-1/2/3 large subunit
MNNNGYGTIAGLQMAHFELTYGTLFPGEIGDRVPDYAAIARAYGADGVTIERADEFRPALEAALASGRPTVLDVPMKNNPTPTTGHWNILDIYSPGRDVSHVATD